MIASKKFDCFLRSTCLDLQTFHDRPLNLVTPNGQRMRFYPLQIIK
jgi:hypothetical protein